MPNIFDRRKPNAIIVSGVHPSMTVLDKPDKVNNTVIPDVQANSLGGIWGDMIWDDSISEELNTYRNLNPIALAQEPVLNIQTGKEEHVFGNGEGRAGALEGRFSLFNHNNAVLNNTTAQIHMNAPLYDSPTIRRIIREQSDCSVRALVDASEHNSMGRAIYRYSDFMFCKHLGKISNNYLITLRRFPLPAGDHINYTLPSDKNGKNKEYNGHMPDIGRLVTWLGTPGNDMSSILKYDVNLPYKEMKAEIQQSTVNADSGGGALGAIMNLSSSGYRGAALRGSAGSSSITWMSGALKPFGMGSNLKSPADTSWAYHRDMTKAYGPVDAIASTHIRAGAEDGGIKFEHNITLTFDYELRAFDGINTRAAMLDLLSNILAVTYSNATYWGGAIHGNGAAQNNIWANLPIFKMQSPVSMASLTSSIFDSAGQIGKAFNNNQEIKSLNDFLNALGNFANGFVDVAVSGLLNSLGRPQRQGLNSLLNFAPTGVWHLMIGNPKHPIMSMGNMILDNCTIEHYGPLGLDDFPTGLKVTITLKHGTPRDTMKIEQMYMNGDFRIYQPLGNQGLKAWRNAKELYQNDKTVWNSQEIEELASAIDKNTGDSGNDAESTPETITEAARKIASSDATYIKYYGTTEPIDILKTNMEAQLGSEPKTTAQEAEARDKVMEAKKEKAKSENKKADIANMF